LHGFGFGFASTPSGENARVGLVASGNASLIVTSAATAVGVAVTASERTSRHLSTPAIDGTGGVGNKFTVSDTHRR
jgi:hypothetical protein